MQILEIMYLLGVQCVSVYAFAIDNFKRPAEEVDALMKLAEERLVEFCQHGCVDHPLSKSTRIRSGS